MTTKLSAKSAAAALASARSITEAIRSITAGMNGGLASKLPSCRAITLPPDRVHARVSLTATVRLG